MVIHHFNRIIRNKWVWGVFAVLISAFFAFDFIFDGRGGENGPRGAGTMADDAVSVEEFDACRKDVLVGMLLQYRREIPIGRDALNREAWTRLSNLKVAEEQHLTASDEDVRQAIISSFPDGKGGVNVMQLRQMCAQAKITQEQFESFIRRQIAITRVLKVAQAASWVSPLERSSAVRDMNDKITVRVATFSHKEASKIKLDEEAFKSYYEANTNSFAVPELVAIKYVKFQADAPDRLAKFSIPEEDLKSYFEDVSDRFGTNAVFETVRPQLEREMQLAKSIEDYSSSLYARVCPEGVKSDDPTDRLAELAKEEKVPVKESPLFARTRGHVMEGFMVDPDKVIPDGKNFLESVNDLDSSNPYFRYRVVEGTNAVYVVSLDTNRCTQARVLTFDEVKKNKKIESDALADLKAKDFKKRVDAVRDNVMADLKKRNSTELDPKVFGDANVSTSITFVARTAMQSRPFPNSYSVIPAAAQLKKGELSELITTGIPGNGVVVYVENREPGEAVLASMYSEVNEGLRRQNEPFALKAWNGSNMARLDIKPSEQTSMEKPQDDGEDLQD